MKYRNMIEIDGSMSPNADEIIRTAFSLSAATEKPCHIFNINQSKLNISKIQIFNEFLNFEEEKGIKFLPNQANKNKTLIRVKAEANENIVLILQALILPALFFKNPVKIVFNNGITNDFFSSTIYYFRYVFLKILEKIGVKVEINIIKQGYYPKGGAEIIATIYPSKLKPLDLTERGVLKKILIVSGASESLKEKKINERQLMGAREVLGKLNLPLEEKLEYYETESPGSQICLAAEFENTIIGSDNLAKMGERAEDVGKQAALNLLKEEKFNACLDKYSTNQILAYLALIKEKSSITTSGITDSSKINIKIIEKFLKGSFKIKNNLITWMPK